MHLTTHCFALAAILGAPRLGQGAPPITAPQLTADNTAAFRSVWSAAIQNLDRRLAELDGKTVVYACQSYANEPLKESSFEPPADAESPIHMQWSMVASVFRKGSAYRVHEHTVSARDADTVGRMVTFSSDGSQFHTRFASAAGGGSNLLLDLRDTTQRVGPEMDAYGWRVMGQVAPFDFQYYLNFALDSADLAVLANTDDACTVSWRLPDAIQTKYIATIDKPSSSLRTLVMEVYGGDASLPTSKLTLRKSVELREFHLGERLVRGARVMDQLPDAGPDYPGVWAITEVVPVLVEATPCRDELVHLSPLVGDRIVQDTRFDVAYQPPDKRLNLDGRLIPLDGSPVGDVGWSLDNWVRDLAPVSMGKRDDPSNVPDRPVATPGRFDAGKVRIGDEPVRVAHDFSLRNDTRATWIVEQIIKSCGCLTCTINKTSISPGEEAIVSMAMTVLSPGVREQSVAVILDNGKIEQFEMSAQGCVLGSLRVVCSGLARVGSDRTGQIRAYWVESDPNVLADVPSLLTLKQDGDVTLAFDGWTEVEPAAKDGSRPRRLFGRGLITLPDALGAPKELVFKAASGRTFSLPVLYLDEAQ